METQIHKKNVPFHFIDAASFFIGISLCSFQVIVPAYVKNYTSNAFLLALIPFIWDFGQNGTQVISVYRTHRKVKSNPIRNYFLWETLHRGSFLLIGLSILIFGHKPLWALISFYIFFSISNISWGMAIPQWTDSLSVTIPDKIRARFMGNRDAVARVVGIIASFSAPFILSVGKFPNNYGILFLIAGSFFTAGAMAIGFLKPYRQFRPQERPEGFLSFLKKGFKQLTLHKSLRNYLIAFWMLGVSRITYAYLTPYLIDNVITNYPAEMHDKLIGLLNTNFLIAGAVGAVLVGLALHHWKHKTTLILGILSLALTNIMNIILPSMATALISHYFLGFAMNMIFLAVLNTVMDHTTTEKRSERMAIFNLINVAGVAIFSLIGSVISTAFNFKVALLFGGIFGVVILIYSAFLSNPKHEEEELAE